MKQQYSISFQRLAHFLITVTLLTFILIVGRGFLIPLAFAMVIAFLLVPISNGVESFIPARGWAIALTLFLVILPMLGMIGLFGIQLSAVFTDFRDIIDGLMSGVTRLVDWANRSFRLRIHDTEEWLKEGLTGSLDRPFSVLTSSISSSTIVLGNILLTIIYTFFLLLYRTSFKNFLLGQFGPRLRLQASEVLEEVQDVIQQYLYGLLLVIAILAVLNSLGLFLIGIKYAFFWGFLAACLAIIPYIGTTLGGLLPFLYAVATSDSLMQPVLVVLLYMGIQSLEGNFITPKVVGNSVHINPFAAILALILGGLVWGIPGMILALPLVAILKITLENIETTRPMGLLLSDRLYECEEDFLTVYDHDRYRLFTLFKKKEKNNNGREKVS